MPNLNRCNNKQLFSLDSQKIQHWRSLSVIIGTLLQKYREGLEDGRSQPRAEILLCGWRQQRMYADCSAAVRRMQRQRRINVWATEGLGDEYTYKYDHEYQSKWNEITNKCKNLNSSIKLLLSPWLLHDDDYLCHGWNVGSYQCCKWWLIRDRVRHDD